MISLLHPTARSLIRKGTECGNVVLYVIFLNSYALSVTILIANGKHAFSRGEIASIEKQVFRRRSVYMGGRGETGRRAALRVLFPQGMEVQVFSTAPSPTIYLFVSVA